jgi:hypothetical protein
VEETLEFPVLLRLIDERSTAFRAAVMSAPDLDLQVPTCPEWTLLDLAQHLGGVHRFWAAAVNAGPAAAPPAESAPERAGPPPGARAPTGLVGRIDAAAPGFAARSRPESRLLDVVGSIGVAPDLRCRRPAPASGGHGAHLRRPDHPGRPQPLPDEAALDGVEEFLSTCCAWTAPWPHEAAAVDFHATEGRSWRLSLAADGARISRLPTPAMPATAAGEGPGVAFASARGAAAELVLVLYDRIPVDSLQLDGDRRLFDLLRAWE